MKPKISVIIPTFNRSNLVRRAIDSVLAQTYRDFELLVVDDHSPVPVAEALTGISDPRLHLIRHEKNSGAPKARNTGIIQSCGEYVSLLDDDDEFLPQYLERLMAKLSQCPLRTGVVHGGIRFLGAGGEVIQESLPKLKGNIRSHLLRGEKDSNVMGLVRRQCFTDVGLFDEQLSSCQDWDMWLRISEQYDFDILEEVVALYHCHGAQLSSDFRSLIRGRTRMIEKHRALFAQDPQALIIHLKRLGKLHALNGTWKDSWHWFSEVAAIDRVEVFKVIAWLLWDYPYAKWVSPVKGFRTYHDMPLAFQEKR